MSNPPPSTSFLPFDALFNNPLFAGGLGLAGLGAVAALGRRSVIQGASLIKRRLLIDVEISKQDAAYNWVLAWLCLPRPSGDFITSKLTRIHHLSLMTAGRAGQASPNTHTHFSLQPGYGKYIIRHKNAYIQVNREKQTSSNMNTGEPHETVTLTTLYAHRNIFEDIFAEAHQLAASAQEGKTINWKPRGMEWGQFGDARTKRPLSSVILDQGIKEGIVDDVKDFLARRKWYTDRGIPYRRGYLLYGPPGSGKSSFIQALAGELDLGLATISLSERGLTDDKLAHLLMKMPASSILLLEDADAAFRNRKQADSDGYGGANVTFSGLLNALDGVAAAEDRIAFLTTNHIGQLDDALIRPGRVDMRVEIGFVTMYQAASMFDRFYGHVDEDGKGREKFLQRLEALGFFSDRKYTTAAGIQGLFLYNKESMDGAIEMAETKLPVYHREEN